VLDPLGPRALSTWFSVYHACELGGLVLLAVFFNTAGLPLARRFGALLDRAASRPSVVVAAIGLGSLLGCAAVGLFLGMPEPAIHDEFSYLLSADTFLHGRLTNPQHPHWHFFETIHVIHEPTYQSKYMPGQGLVLALGRLVAGDAIVGTWLCVAAACAATAWMLQGWLPPRWALVGGLLAALRMGVVGYWAQSHWGGALPALGGALVFGALPRILRAPSTGAALAMGAGLAATASSRPFEGAVAALPVAAALAWRLLARPRPFPRRDWLLRAAAPIALCLAATAGGIATYNAAVTGSAVRLPYFEHQRQYARISQFLWGTPPPRPEYRHESMRIFFEEDERPVWERQRTPWRFLAEGAWKVLKANDTPLGVLMYPVIALAAALWRRRRLRLPLGSLGLLWLSMAGLTVVMSHYMAPATACGFLAATLAVRHLSTMRVRGRRLRGLALALVAGSAALLVYRATQHAGGDPFGRVRAHYVQELEDRPGDHLVFVRYGQVHISHNEWVYNGADIDRQRVVWARDMGSVRNRDLLGYYPGRTAWLMTVNRDEDPPDLGPYPR
jgi:hypothetical protein